MINHGKKKMMSGGRSSKDSGLRTHRILARNKSTPMPRQEGIKQATKQRLAKADGGKMKYGHGGEATNGNKMARREYSKGGVASAMKTAKPC